MKIFIAILVFLILFMGFSGCSEDPVVQPPEISFFRVINSGAYYALDTLKFDLSAKSDRPLTSLKMSLKSDQGTVLVSQVWNQLNSNEIALNDEDFHLSRKTLETDTYTLEALVYGENGTVKDVRDVQIAALMPEIKKVLLVSHNNDFTTQVGFLDHDLMFSELFSLSGDFLDAYVDSDDDIIFTVGNMTGNLICSDLDASEELWQFGVDTNPPFPKFRAATSSDNHIWVSIHPDYILGLDHIGEEKFRSSLSIDRYPESMIVSDRYLVAEEYSKSTAKKTLSKWYVQSGVLAESCETFADDLILLDARDNELYYVEVHDAISSLYILDLVYNDRRWLFDYPGVFNLSCRGPHGKYFLSSGSGLYIYSPDYTIEYKHTFNHTIKSMTYDYLNATLYLIAGNTVYKYSTEQDIVEKTNTFDASPDKVLIQYNRNLFTSEMY